MSSTHTRLNYHVIFGTKNRIASISISWKASLYDYMGGVIRGLEGQPRGIGGTTDHVHILMELKPTHQLCAVVREIKKATSKWIHNTHNNSDFAWQEGYAAFTASITSLQALQSYISCQDTHHSHKSFMDELREIYGKAGIEYDPRYL